MHFSMFESVGFAPCVSSGDEDQGLDQLYGTLIDIQH